MSYMLRCSIYAHSSDVRAVATLENCVISGSRDFSVKMWTECGNTYEQAASLNGHSNFVSAIAILPPSTSFPLGLIITGSHDHLINGYIPYTDEPLVQMRGHTAPVSHLHASVTPGLFLSGSWDNTAKVWDSSTGEVLINIEVETACVWSVIDIPEGYILAATSDKTIKVYFVDGTYVHSLIGHTDVVRDLLYNGHESVLSCSNDGTLRKWHVVSGDCLTVFNAHDSYIYSLVREKETGLIAICGENSFLSVIDKDLNPENFYKISHPGTSVWAISFLPNTDIVTGSSDGYIRVFTRDPTRCEQVVLGTSDMPGREAIRDKGTFDGESRVIHEHGKNYCYVWSSVRKTWDLIGEGFEQKQKTSKQIFEGQEYDFVFDVDIEDGKEPLKFPFNRGDDPTFTAQRFIIKHGLNPDYLEKIVAFIGENVGQITSPDAPSTSTSKTEVEVMSEAVSYYPPEGYVFFDQHDVDLIFKKLEEFMNIMDYSQEENVHVLGKLRALMVANGISDGITVLIDAITNWPEEFVFPLLDIARIVCRNDAVHNVLFTEEFAQKFLVSIDRCFTPEALAPNRLFLFRILSNMFSSSLGENLIIYHRDEIVIRLTTLVPEGSRRNLQVAASTFVVNLSLLCLTKSDSEGMELCFDYIRTVLPCITDPEATFRLLVALGTVGVFEGTQILSVEIRNSLLQIASWDLDKEETRKAARCASSILQDLDVEHRR